MAPKPTRWDAESLRPQLGVDVWTTLVSWKGSEIRPLPASWQRVFCLRPSCPAPGPWPLLAPAQQPSALASSGLISYRVSSIPITASQNSLRFLPKLVLSKTSLCSAPQASVGCSRNVCTPPPQLSRGPSPASAPRPALRGGPDLLPGSSAPPSVPAPYPAPGSLSSIVSRLQRLCRALLLLPASHFLLCLQEGGRRARASWRDGAGSLLPGPLLSLLAHPFVSFSGLSCRSPSTPPCRSCFVGFSPVSGSSSLSFFPYFFFFSSPSFPFSPCLSLPISRWVFFESLSLGLCTVLRVPVLNQKQKRVTPAHPRGGPYQHPISSRFWCYRGFSEDM